MKRLDRYVLREMIVPFLLGTVVIVFMFQANMLIALGKQFNMGNVPPAAIAQYILFKTPGFLQMTLPIGTAFAASLTVARLVRESELTAMRAAGVKIRRVVLPIILAGLAVSFANFYVVERVMPPSERRARDLLNEVAPLALSPDFRSNIVISMRGYQAWIGAVQKGPGGSLQLNDIMLMERRANQLATVITAERGRYADGVWSLDKPLIRIFEKDNLVSARPRGQFEIMERISIPDLFSVPMQDEKPMSELARAIAEGRRLNQDTRNLEISFHTRFSVPAACLVFAIAGPFFSVRFSRSGPFVGVLVSFVMVLAYYNAHVIFTEIFGRSGLLPPLVAAWGPNAIFALLGLLALRRLE